VIGQLIKLSDQSFKATQSGKMRKKFVEEVSEVWKATKKWSASDSGIKQALINVALTPPSKFFAAKIKIPTSWSNLNMLMSGRSTSKLVPNGEKMVGPSVRNGLSCLRPNILMSLRNF
jgi:hypothetical protein